MHLSCVEIASDSSSVLSASLLPYVYSIVLCGIRPILNACVVQISMVSSSL
jgi:hypothetical protein